MHRYNAFAVLIVVTCIATEFAWAQDDQVDQTPSEQTPDAQPSEPTPIKLDFISEDVQSRMLDDEYQLVDVEIESKAYQFPIFVERAKRPISLGTIFLIPDASQNGTPLNALMPLAQEFAMQGWNSVIMPTPQVLIAIAEVEAKRASEQASKAATETEQAQTDAQTNTLEPREAELVLVPAKQQDSLFEQAYHQAFSTYLTMFVQATQKKVSFSGYKVLFAQGISAQIMLSALEQSTGNLPDALIINNIYLPNNTLNKDVPDLVARSTLPVLDIVSPADNYWSMYTREQRQVQSEVKIKAFYRQREVNALAFSPSMHSDIATEAKGWFRYLGW
jgi:hypothetical protein